MPSFKCHESFFLFMRNKVLKFFILFCWLYFITFHDILLAWTFLAYCLFSFLSTWPTKYLLFVFIFLYNTITITFPIPDVVFTRFFIFPSFLPAQDGSSVRFSGRVRFLFHFYILCVAISSSKFSLRTGRKNRVILT